MKNTRDRYWGYGLDSTHPLIIHACRKLDDLNIEYDIKHHQGECSMYRGGTSINFKETQDDDILKTKIITDDFNLQRINKFEHEVVIDSDNDFMKCDNWLEKNVGVFNEQWLAGTHQSVVNTYYFVNETDAMHFKLMWS